jgi:DNA polymerase-1
VTDAQSLAESLKPLAAARVIALDTETTGLDPHQHKIRLIQIAVQDRPVVIVDLGAIAPDALDPLRQLLTSPAIKVFHNGKFDWKFLIKAGLKPTGPYFDTMLANQLLKAGLPGSHSLKVIAAEYLGIELDVTPDNQIQL